MLTKAQTREKLKNHCISLGLEFKETDPAAIGGSV